MVQKKTNPLIVIVIIIISIFLLSQFKFEAGSIIPVAGKEIAEDFETGFDSSKIEIVNGRDNIFVRNGFLELQGARYGDKQCSTLERSELICTGGLGSRDDEGSVKTVKEFNTEDIFIKYKVQTSAGDGTFGFDPRIIYNSQNINLNLICSNEGCKQEGIISINRYDDLDLNKYRITDSNGNVILGRNENPEPIFMKGGGMFIDYIQFEPYFSCLLDSENEVIVTDRFTSGSFVSLDTLSFLPTKFCPQDLGVIIITEDGATDELGSITEAIASGEVIKIPEGQDWEIDYITKFVDEMSERCDIGQRYDTSINKCVSKVRQQIDTNTLLFCEQDSDCLIPSNCNDATVSCVSNQCDYQSSICTPEQIINFVEVIKTVEVEKPQLVFVSEQKNEITFQTKAGLTVAGQPFNYNSITPNRDKNVCPIANGEYLSMLVPNCYTIDVDWGDLDFDAKNLIETKINDQVSVTYLPEGRGVYLAGECKCYDENSNGDKVCRSCDYEYPTNDALPKNFFKASFTDIFDLSINNYQEKVLLGSDSKVNLIINNKFMDLPQAGYKIKVSQGITSIFLPFETKDLNIKQGINNYEISLPTDKIGINTVEIVPFFKMIDDQEYISDERVVISYYVTSEPTTLTCQITGCSVGECTEDGICLVTTENVEIVNEESTDITLPIVSDKTKEFNPLLIAVIILVVIIIILSLKKK